MTYTVILKNLSFKQNFTSVKNLLDDQPSTYVILKYCDELPDDIYKAAIEDLTLNIREITDKRLLELILNSY